MVVGSIEIKNKYIWIVAGILAGIILIFLLLWLINSSFIEVKITNGQNGEYSYSFLNQSSNKTVLNKTSSNPVKQLLPTSSYEVLAQQDYKSFFGVVKTQHLLANSYIEASLLPENYREFVGNNPQDCMNYINSQLISYSCDGVLANALVHMPATSNTPTYVTTTKGQGPAGYDEGFLTTSEGTFVLSQLPVFSENGAKQVLYRVGKNFVSSEVIFMPQLDDSIRYKSLPYKTGFIVFTPNFDQILYYPSIKSQGANITVTKVNSADTNPISLDIKDDSILTSYTNKVSNSSKTQQTKVFINTNSEVQTYTLNKSYSKVSFCGQSMLCMLNNSVVDVYNINSDQITYNYSLNNVVAMQNTNSGFLIVNSVGVVNIDVNNKVGFISYTLGGYKFNNIVPAQIGYIVSLTNTKGNKVALYIDQTKTNNTNIDKKVLELLTLSEISNISIYGNYLTIVPNLPTTENARGQTVVDTSKLKDVNNSIDNAINKLDIKKYGFEISNTSS